MFCQRLPEPPKIRLLEPTKEAIERNWQRFTNWRPTREAATLCRLLDTKSNVIYIATDVTYKEVVGLRWQQTIDQATIPFQVVTAAAIVYTADAHLILIPRDSGDWEASLECPGGFIRATYLNHNRVSVEDFITARVKEDMHLEQTEINTVRYRTTYNAPLILEYMLVYKITLTLTTSELLARHPTFTVMPPIYTPEQHHTFTKQALHPPSKGALLAAHADTTTHQRSQ